MGLCVVMDSGTGALTGTSTPVESCATYVLMSPGEYTYATASSAWALSLQDGVDIGVAILGVWALAWCFRMVAKAILSIDEGKEIE